LPTANVNDISINYEIDGGDTGKGTIVLINGLADDLLSWGFQIPALLAAGYRVLRFDNRGIGKTDRPAGPYTSKLMAEDAKALVDHLGLSGFHLMGVSMGGMIAQEFAVAHPGDLLSVTLACTYGKADAFCQTMFAMWADMANIGMDTVPFFSERPAEAAEFAAAMGALDMSVDTYLAQLNVIQQHDAMSRVGRIPVPTLVLAGEEDILIPVRLSKDLREAIPGSQWKTTKGGHACLWESPEPFNAAFLDFLS
jgi:3-oxoadipate enol-lactonase